MDNLIEIASFTFPNDVNIVETLLQRENIRYEIENMISATMIPGAEVKLLIYSEDTDKVVALLKEGGFEGNLINNELI